MPDDEQPTPDCLLLRADQIDEFVRFTMRHCMKPHLKGVYRTILGESFHKPDINDFLPKVK